MTRISAVLLVSLIPLAGVTFTAFAGNGSGSPAMSSSGFLLTANKGSHTLSIINPQEGVQVVEVPEGGVTGHEVAASPDGRTAFVPIYGDSGVGKPGTDGKKIAVIDLQTHKVTDNIDFTHGVRPHCAVFGPKDGLLYVTTELDKTITVIDPKALKIIGTIPTDQAESHMLAISRDGSRGYTANVGPGTVSVLDMPSRKLVTVIHVSKQVQRISISPDGAHVFTADQEKPRLAVIDTASNKVTSWITLPALGFGTTPTHDGKWLLATMPSVNKIAVIDLHTRKVARTIDVPSAPQEILVRPDDQVAYVSCDQSHQIAAVQTSDWTVAKLIDAGKTADGLAWAAAE